ncbi:SAG-related sequence [Besnoitia besnoiti]|uniref:SAG-related sequence n=1 Tax=Besnoitia besnoiti TaxID=94643 RepID=A0A2A9MGC1_BESBE|nr:SAG-related sequence [Besnoitia besnoiti]PFH37035.1 SAG-related sequence [Besnoitia besnoiti]
MVLCVGGVQLVARGGAVEGRPREVFLPRDLQLVTREEQASTLCRSVLAPGQCWRISEQKHRYRHSQGSTAVPENDDEACVVEPDANVSTCENDRKSTLQHLLQAKRNITWVGAKGPTDEHQGKARTLELTEDDLPFTDKSFFVGCKSAATGQLKSAPAAAKTCRIDVSVLARSSKVEENVVTYAYGAESNPRPLEVELTSRNNTVVVACGADGSIAPPSYNTHYCDDTLQSCDKSYTDIFPKFDSTWWSGEAGKDDAPVKLTIQKESFPVEDQRFYVGCSPKKNGDGSSGGSRADAGPETQAPAASPTRCKVMFTVRAAAASSSVSSIVGDVVAAAGTSAVDAPAVVLFRLL